MGDRLWMDAFIEQLERLGLPSKRIHTLEGVPLWLSDLLPAGDGGLLLHLL